MKAIVQYQVGQFKGLIDVHCNENDDDECIIAKARKKLTQMAGGSLPFGYENWKIISKKY